MYALVPHCLLPLVGGKALNDFATIESYGALKALCKELMEKYMDTKQVAKMRDERSASPDSTTAGDMVFQNAALFLRELTDAIKAGDSGRVPLALKIMSFSFRGNGRSKYATEMLYFAHNIAHVWPQCLR